MLVVKYLRSDQVFLCWIINEHTRSLLDQINDRLRLIRRNSRTTIASTAELIHLQEIGTDILRAMHNNSSPERPVIEAPFHPSDPQGKPVASIIGVLRHIEAQTALA